MELNEGSAADAAANQGIDVQDPLSAVVGDRHLGPRDAQLCATTAQATTASRLSGTRVRMCLGAASACAR